MPSKYNGERASGTLDGMVMGGVTHRDRSPIKMHIMGGGVKCALPEGLGEKEGGLPTYPAVKSQFPFREDEG